jgi:diguanylate cyclase (GGDEF)-like protein/PAS domain S-box-containing protein
MNKAYSSWQKHTDKYSALLSFFFVVLLLLLGYLVKTDQEISAYSRYYQKLDTLRILNYRFNSFFEQTYRYIDYDETEKLDRRFEETIQSFDPVEIKSEFGENIYVEIEEIKILYTDKKVYFEDFKALNARVTNSIHFLYDLRKTLEKKLINDSAKKILLDNIFFSISQILMNLPYDRKNLLVELNELEKYSKTYPEFLYFIQHSRQFLHDVSKIKALKYRVVQIPILASIEKLLKDLSLKYDSKRNQQRMIVVSLFLFAFIILGLLIYSYRRIRKSTKELQAFRYAIENSDNAILLTNPKREIEYVNESFEKMTGYTKEEILGKTPAVLKSGLLPEQFYKEMNETLDRGEIWQGEIINRRKDGALLYEKSSIIPIYIDGELIQYLAIKLDITAYKEQQIRLKQAAAVYEVIGDGILVTDRDKHIIAVNPAFEEMFGYSREELIGKEPMVIRMLNEDIYFYKQMWNNLLTHDRWSGKLHSQTKDGSILPVWLTLTIVRDENGEIKNFIAIYTNLQEIIATQEKAEYLAYHDSLTGLPNRAYFDLRIKDILDVAQRSQRRVAILFLDLDRFKVINDTLGHAVGDRMLVELAKRMERLFDDNVLFARMGGDEFVITFILKNGKKEILEMAERILSVIREPVQVNDYNLNTTASIGIAIFPDDGKEKHEIIKYADSAMYAAKEKGKDTYQFYTRKLSLDVQKRLHLEQELLHALEREEFYLHFQPQYLLADRKVKGAEALLRWESQKLGNIPPDQFILIAEETGMIVKIGYFVFEEACRAFKKWEKEGVGVERISVNISSVQFHDEHFMVKIKEILARYGVDAGAVEIEITERFIMEYSTTNMTILEDLRKLGCRISIDDFGTGYSSMSYMKQLPLDTIKIDRSFITDLPHDTHDTEVSKAIIALSKSLGYEVVAEGIENEQQEIFLQKHGCDYGQGYYFAPPIDEKSFLDFLKKQNI